MPTPLHLFLSLLLTFGIFLNETYAESRVEAPNFEAQAVNQLDFSNNACGPASLINSYRFGSKHWQKLEKKLQGTNPKERMTWMVKAYGLRVSKHIKSQIRWNRNSGINAEDLTDIANEIRSGTILPHIKNESQFLHSDENHHDLLKRTHKRLRKSLKKGFPPLMAIQRQVRRQLPNRSESIWMNIQSHFITVISTPKKIPKGARSFSIEYIDPWRGRKLTATIHIPNKSFKLGRADVVKYGVTLDSPSLAIDCPHTAVGRKHLKENEASTVIVGTVIGAW